jgi:predicted nucleic acid-binding protein
VTEAVLDASVVLNWFAQTPERGQPEARALRDDYQAGRLAVVVPSLFFLESLNVAGRRWGWDELALGELAGALEGLLFEVAEPELARVAAWVYHGLTAYDATYVALAEERAVPLITDDETIVKVAGEIARPLVPR